MLRGRRRASAPSSLLSAGDHRRPPARPQSRKSSAPSASRPASWSSNSGAASPSVLPWTTVLVPANAEAELARARERAVAEEAERLVARRPRSWRRSRPGRSGRRPGEVEDQVAPAGAHPAVAGVEVEHVAAASPRSGRRRAARAAGRRRAAEQRSALRPPRSRSFPSPPRRRSLAEPPSRRSWPAPPSSVSLPADAAQRVVAGQAADEVVAGERDERVGAGGAGEHVVVGRGLGRELPLVELEAADVGVAVGRQRPVRPALVDGTRRPAGRRR